MREMEKRGEEGRGREREGGRRGEEEGKATTEEGAPDSGLNQAASDAYGGGLVHLHEVHRAAGEHGTPHSWIQVK